MAQKGSHPRRPGFRTILSEAEVRSTVRELAAAITQDHPHGEPLVVVAVLKGALVFLADLIRHLLMPLEIELVNARSYQGSRRQPVVEILDDVAELRLSGRHVLLLDCVLDSGHTLAALREAISAQSPASLKTCVLLRKERPGAVLAGKRDSSVPIEPEYVGVEIPDLFVVGYGLDHGNLWRHLPYIAELPAHPVRSPCSSVGEDP